MPSIVTETQSHYNAPVVVFANFVVKNLIQGGKAIVSNADDGAQGNSPKKVGDPLAVVPASAAKMLPKIIPFRDLCRCGDEVWIEHEGQLYRLRCTKQGKLLLTK